MVMVKKNDLLKAIQLTKMRIKHHEKHGCGLNAMAEKVCLRKQERSYELKYK